MATHVRNALRDHPAPEHFLALFVLDTSPQAPPLGAIMHTMLHADEHHPPLRVFAAMIPLLIEGVHSYAALHHRIDPLSRAAAFLAVVSIQLPELKHEVRHGALALLPLATAFAEGPQQATARSVTMQLTNLIYGSAFPRHLHPHATRRAA